MKPVLSVFLVAAAALLSTGCGKSSSSVVGSVTYKGSPVTGGTMLFHGSDKVIPASLGVDGNYACPNVPPGDYTVTIDTTSLKNIGDPESMMKKMAKEMGTDGSGEKLPEALSKDFAKMKEMGSMPKYTPIPEKYANKKTSGLTMKVESGSNTKDWQLTD